MFDENDEQIVPVQGITTEIPEGMVLTSKTAEILMRLDKEKVIRFEFDDGTESSKTKVQLKILETKAEFFCVERESYVFWIISEDTCKISA